MLHILETSLCCTTSVCASLPNHHWMKCNGTRRRCLYISNKAYRMRRIKGRRYKDLRNHCTAYAEIDKRGRGVKQKFKAKGKSVWEKKGRNTSVLRYSETQDTGSRTATWYHGLLLCWRWRRKSCRHGCTVCLYRYTYYPGCRLRMRWVR